MKKFILITLISFCCHFFLAAQTTLVSFQTGASLPLLKWREARDYYSKEERFLPGPNFTFEYGGIESNDFYWNLALGYRSFTDDLEISGGSHFNSSYFKGKESIGILSFSFLPGHIYGEKNKFYFNFGFNLGFDIYKRRKGTEVSNYLNSGNFPVSYTGNVDSKKFSFTGIDLTFVGDVGYKFYCSDLFSLDIQAGFFVGARIADDQYSFFESNIMIGITRSFPEKQEKKVN